MGQHRRKAVLHQPENGLQQPGAADTVGHLHENVLIAVVQQIRQRIEVFVHHILRGQVQGNLPGQVLGQRGHQVIEPQAQLSRLVGEHGGDVGRQDKALHPFRVHGAQDGHGIRKLPGAVIDTGENMGVNVAAESDVRKRIVVSIGEKSEHLLQDQTLSAEVCSGLTASFFLRFFFQKAILSFSFSGTLVCLSLASSKP